ncbi:hypothetical protein F5B22DRAFT_596547 [Xylaria bambusicola]|uniref:uncharacterized protein n=1 Tax=Xylaria bambusicola TaxID=326684 RepID=UPI002007DF6D|nr:uncharacterized protein F5B22DRAFT_596547 [Xylaria bambusicola]KAI0521327.1 hypothetical protein F5B22DRAFT_596547 [Xylaria bambusicola]
MTEYFISTSRRYLQIPHHRDPDIGIPQDVTFVHCPPSPHRNSSYQFNLQGRYFAVDTLIDNGQNNGYTGLNGGYIVARGRLLLWDAIDGEMIILNGGPIGLQWYTHFPADFIWPPQHVIDRYKVIKATVRKDILGNESFHKEYTRTRDIDHRQSLGKPVYCRAPSDPFTFFGLGETDKVSHIPYCMGYAFETYWFPTMLEGLGIDSVMPGTAVGMDRSVVEGIQKQATSKIQR